MFLRRETETLTKHGIKLSYNLLNKTFSFVSTLECKSCDLLKKVTLAGTETLIKKERQYRLI